MKDPPASLVDLLSFLIAVLGLAASGFFYIRGKEIAKPLWRSAGIPLIGGSSSLLPADVDVRYRSVSVQSLSKTYVAFWNAGRKTISGSDIVAADPVRFCLNRSCKVLDARIIRKSRQVNRAVVAHHDNEVQLTFDFLDQGDGVTLELIHTGITVKIKCIGTIKGVPRGVRQVGGPRRRSSKSGGTFVPEGFRSPSKVFQVALSALAALLGAGAMLLYFDTHFDIYLFNGPFNAFNLSYKYYLSQHLHYSYKAYFAFIKRVDLLGEPFDINFARNIALFLLGLTVLAALALVARLRHQLPAELSLTAKDISDRPVDRMMSERPAGDMLA
jgi:hypothetical protein